MTAPSSPGKVTIHQELNSWETPDSPLRLRTKLSFAVITALGGMLLGTGSDTGSLAIVIVAFSIIGFVCVDWQKLFALPSLVAYAAMALTATVCIADFVQDGDLLGRKMVAVAQLLAVAQAILMLQEKTHRLFEQLLIFALLNCVVAAVFNDAFSYAIWFIPLTIAAGFGLAFLAADETVSAASESEQAANSPSDRAVPGPALYSSNNGAAVRSLSRVATRLPWTSMILVIPAVSTIAAAIFFALPRQVEAQRGGSAEALTGFSDSIRLGKIRRMQMNTARALRIRLYDPKSKRPYPVVGGIYLRGQVLEHYVSEKDVVEGGGSWQSVIPQHQGPPQSLPPQYVPRRASDHNFFDLVHVDVQCEAMVSPALFVLAPYHRTMGSEVLVNYPAQWTVGRKPSRGVYRADRWYPRIDYTFATQGFREGVQSQWIGDLALAPSGRVASDEISLDRELDGPPSERTAEEKLLAELLLLSAGQLEYRDELLDYPELAIPAAKRIAQEVVSEIPAENRNPVTIAKRLEQHLATSSQYEYTLDLDSKIDSGMDPIEQFLSVERRGHCQYFASALAMMLRSQEIPCRLVVGYHSDEFNELSQRFTVRQSHAHAWVEALIDRDDLPLGTNVYGQPKSERYWLRLDATPGGGGVPDRVEASSRQQITEIAQNLWNDYIVEMDPQVQQSTLLATPGFAPMTSSYQEWIEAAKRFAFRVNAGEVHGIGGGRLFSGPAAIAAIGLGLAALVFLKIRFPNWFRRRGRQDPAQRAARPSIAFYAEALELLEKAGYARASGQTPAELTATLPDDTLQAPMSVLTQLFYRRRYRDNLSGTPSSEIDNESQSQTSIAESLQQIRNLVALPDSGKNPP